MKQFKVQRTRMCAIAITGMVAALCAADGPSGKNVIGSAGSTGATGAGTQVELGGGDAVEVTVTGTVFFNGIGDPPLGGVNAGDSASLSFLVDPSDFMDGGGNTRGYVIDETSFALTLGLVEIGLANPFPAGQTPYFTLADGIPVSDRFWVSTSPNSPGGVPLAQDPFQLDVDLGYTGETLGSLDILDALGTYDFDGLTSFSYNIWAIFPDNVALGIDFEQLTIAAPDDGGPEMVTICHIPPGNPDNAHTITVSINALAAHLAHGDIIGGCDDGGCQSNDECNENEYCAKEVGDCEGQGECAEKPELCITVYIPVCGCDGQTYSNACYAAAAGVNVAFEGECEPTGNPACGPDAGECCEANGSPGCNNDDCCNLICDADPFCCDTTWDTICANLALASCESCGGSEPLGRCCQGGFTGIVCLVNTEEQCMSSGQFISWDEGEDCPDGDATCAGDPCGEPGSGDCCVSNGSPGCEDPECCSLICDLDPFCCENTWDGLCAEAALMNCEGCAGPLTLEPPLTVEQVYQILLPLK